MSAVSDVNDMNVVNDVNAASVMIDVKVFNDGMLCML